MLTLSQKMEVFLQLAIGQEVAHAFTELLQERVPLFIEDTSLDPRIPGDLLEQIGFREMLLLPLLAQGSVRGTMLVDCDISTPTASQQMESRLQNRECQAVLQSVAYQVAAAIESIRLREAQLEEAYTPGVDKLVFALFGLQRDYSTRGERLQWPDAREYRDASSWVRATVFLCTSTGLPDCLCF